MFLTSKYLIAYFVMVLGMSLLMGHYGLTLLHRWGAGQRIRDEGPKSHYKKSGTPTFGGLFFILPLILMALVSYRYSGFNFFRHLVLAVTCFGLIGFCDDYIKVYVRKGGLTVKQKTVLMSLALAGFIIYYLYFSPEQIVFRLPFSGQELAIVGLWKVLYGIFAAVYLYFVINAVNLTDGVDGLAGSVTLVAGLASALIALKLGRDLDFTGSSIYFCLGLAAGLLGFLAFNKHPAKLMMGDTGSLALGAGLALLYLYFGLPWAVLLVGFIYIVEALSVVIQVSFFKATGGRRIFKMTPIHHHFELSGWSEWKIVIAFSLVTIILSGLAYVII